MQAPKPRDLLAPQKIRYLPERSCDKEAQPEPYPGSEGTKGAWEINPLTAFSSYSQIPTNAFHQLTQLKSRGKEAQVAQER